jgi:hypothetical protein
MTDLSPAARTIVQAFDERHELLGPLEGNWQEACLAAALRAAADQVVPEPNDIDKGSFSLAAIRNRCKVRDQLLVIAAELEGKCNG